MTEYANVYTWDEKQFKGFIEEIQRAGILDFKEKVVSFRHGSFLDYFGAFYIWDNREKLSNLEDFVVRIYFDDFWGDVAFFYIGLQRKIEISLLNKLFTYPIEDPKTFADKFLIGRLLQAGWHSTSDTLYQGIQKATNYAPIIREESDKILDKSEKPVPKITSDLLVMLLADHSFGSVFLLRGAKQLFKYLEIHPTYHNAYRIMSLLWALQRYFEKDDFRDSIKSIEGFLGNISAPDIEENVRILTLLAILGSKDEDVSKTLTRKVRRVFKRYPGMQQRLLGAPKRKRFRTKKTQQKRLN